MDKTQGGFFCILIEEHNTLLCLQKNIVQSKGLRYAIHAHGYKRQLFGHDG